MLESLSAGATINKPEARHNSATAAANPGTTVLHSSSRTQNSSRTLKCIAAQQKA